MNEDVDFTELVSNYTSIDAAIQKVIRDRGLSDYQAAQLLQQLAYQYSFRAVGGHGSVTFPHD
jgi:hypothetical protein